VRSFGRKENQIAGSGCYRRNGSPPYFALSLGNLAWLVRLVLVGARIPGKGKVWGVSPRQTFLLSPPAEQGDEYPKEDYHHGKRNQEP
jgi:hypothetical protein